MPARLSRLHGGERFRPFASERAGGLDLSLLPEQSHRRHGTPRAVGEVGRLRARSRGGHPVRRRLRSLHPGCRRSALHLRDPRRSEMRDRVPQLFKNGGFTGTRCAFTIVPKELECRTDTGERKPLHPLWNRRFSTKFNGVSYVTQRGAEALYSDEEKPRSPRSSSSTWATPPFFGRPPRSADSRSMAVRMPPTSGFVDQKAARAGELFDTILNEANVVITPGSGFGLAGEGYFRISAFNSRGKRPGSRPPPQRGEVERFGVGVSVLTKNLHRRGYTDLSAVKPL